MFTAREYMIIVCEYIITALEYINYIYYFQFLQQKIYRFSLII